ncbi:amidohydrolase family protein [Vampirovibrio chlorellavorus]|uniref:amidohydrolase family protein n=1 Tax=Vampirovibrio chlorellavorus TaxID=758823 RepID=UPI0026ED93AE|nr:amidohydrolase [Vampirovibrio chlorellavorus]
MPIYTADCMYVQGQLQTGWALHVEGHQIAQVLPVETLTTEQQAQVIHFENGFLIPGLVNSHNHSFQSLLKGFCDDQDFFTWRDQALYKYAKILSRDDIYTGALFAFGEMLKCGITTVCDFFYINDQANENARAVIQAALDVGIRMVMARTLYDWKGAPARFRETVSQACENTRQLHAEFKAHPMVQVLPAPHSLHGASPEMILAGAELAEELDSPFHMHIAEGQYERQMIEQQHGKPPVAYLDELGVLNDRLVGIHCVWLDDAEIELMAQRGTGLSYNPSSNMFLGDGITRIREMQAAGVCVSLGTDGGCSNNRASIIEEMRMTSLLQKVKFHDSTVTTAEEMMVMGTLNGGKNLGLPIGALAEGYAADFTVLDLNDLSMQPRQNALKNLVYASQPSAIRAVYVAGKKVLEAGRILTVPEAEIVRRVQLTTAGWD